MGKKHKKEKNDKSSKRVNQSKVKQRSSSNSSTSSEEWIEKDTGTRNVSESDAGREDWMMMETCFSGKTKKELHEEKEKKSPDSKKISLLDCPGQSDRELNPFWKNGGSGFPSDNFDTKKASSSQRIGDNGAQRLRKALQRAKNTAEEEGRSLNDVISERWGSFDEFTKLLKEAERNEKDIYERHNSDKYKTESRFKQDKDYKNDSNNKRLNFRKPEEGSFYDRNTTSSHESRSSKQNWKKPSQRSSHSDTDDTRKERHVATPSSVKKAEKDVTVHNGSIDDGNIKLLTINELNYLYADAFRAELAGKKEIAEELKSKAKLCKLRRITALNNQEIRDENADRVIILMETDNKGFTRPVKSLENCSKGKRKAETHDGNKRIRYFADDDKYSLKDMFEAEKYNTVEDDQNVFMKLAMEEQKNDMDDDAVFDKARMEQSTKEENRKQTKAINKYKKQEEAIENCRWCLGSKTMLYECIIISKPKVYLAVPSSQSLTDRHCLIIPHNHIPCATLLDEDEWEELMDLRKELVRKFSEREEDVIFFEIANNIQNHPHMVLHCVPVPKEIGETAPIYFKKAIMECETEWSNNKKVVELAGRNVRKAVPRGLPYFSVDFGMQSGFAHVIEDKKLFPANFAQEIIGGMLDLDHTIWRKQRRDLMENIAEKVKLIQDLLEEKK